MDNRTLLRTFEENRKWVIAGTEEYDAISPQLRTR